MKLKLFIVAMIFFSLGVNAEKYVIPEKVINGKLCDSCRIPYIYNSEKPLSYMIIGAREVGIEGSFAKNSGERLPFVSTHFTSSAEFSLDFMPVSMLMKHFTPFIVSEPQKQTFLGNKLKQLQYMVLQNNQIIKNWTGISTLANDKNFSVGISDNSKDQANFLAMKTYHAGTFKLNINDSLVVLIKDTVLKQIVESIFIGRVVYFPRLFDVIKFSSDADLQDILNNKINRVATQEMVHKDSIDNFEMQPDETVLFKFTTRGEINHTELEYAFVENNINWKALTVNYDAFQDLAFIAINKPKPGKTIELLLRYKEQPESVHHIKIKVHEKLTGTTFFKIAATLLVAALLFSVWYAFKKRRHQAKLRQLTLTKEETESKLQLLSGQLNPHFLFNSLNSVQNLINKHDTENANLYVTEVSSFLRTIMDAGKKEYISLEEELNMEIGYIKLEQKRKMFNYCINNNCQNHLSQIEFPPSLLQPIIENTIHHGFSRTIDQPLITITINCKEKQLTIIVEDNGQGFDEAFIKPGHGLAIVQKRVALMNEKLSGMPITMNVASTNKGTVTTFTFQNWL